MDPRVYSEMDTIRKILFELVMKAEWKKVVEKYRENANSYDVQITKSKDTVLHIAVFDGQEEIVVELVSVMLRECKDRAMSALATQNEQGDTPLHIAASLGSVKMCKCIAKANSSLLTTPNHNSDTPLFLAVRHGKEEAFHCLYYSLLPDQRHRIFRGNGGDTILHAAIAGEYFNLAFQIIHLYDEHSNGQAHHALVNTYNERGITPLHLLASKPNAFRSGSHLRGYSRLVYYCTFVDDLTVEKPYKEHEKSGQASKETDDSHYPEHCKTLIYFLLLVKRMIKIVFSVKTSERGRDKQNPQARGRVQIFPSNYDTCFQLVKFASKAILVFLGLGSSEISKIKEKKEKHRWAAQLLNELIERATMYEYEESGTEPIERATMYEYEDRGTDNSEEDQDLEQDDCSNQQKGTPDSKTWNTETEEITLRLVMVNEDMTETILNKHFPEGNVDKNVVLMAMQNRKPKAPDMPKIENPILLAAKNGITEMVEKILDKFPVAIHDMNADRKNLVLLAVEHRQPQVYRLLLERNAKDTKGSTVKDSEFRQVDSNGNTALHLAAMLGDYKPWLIPGAALQMQWELKWYEFVENSIAQYSVLLNNAGKTPEDIFSTTHHELVESGGKWLTNTSQSCSVVAALIATVAFATSSNVPGGVKEGVGIPNLESQPAFKVFAVASLVALGFSITSVVMFLAILNYFSVRSERF
ncbi:hypothetical protein K2173_025706 [Erythroxylum novogranatense]|uniref:PGG domain-containing protein n=1 Tax=Erythroxylum novogranatense TaxID=1862640 RepID=A0AAV8SBB9_9ROSI|nr:hypothetical protein K2173_025706 [Erythroxylum novogranatense]